ncbi:MAG: hypothetical protein ACHP65_06390, partial [Legionellales bacterium]
INLHTNIENYHYLTTLIDNQSFHGVKYEGVAMPKLHEAAAAGDLNKIDRDQKSLLASRIKSSKAHDDYRKQIINFVALGDAYARDSLLNHFAAWYDIVYAVALWNYALDLAVRSKLNHLQTPIKLRLQELKAEFIFLKNPEQDLRHLLLSTDASNYWGNRLEKIRASVKDKFDVVPVNNVRFIYEKTAHDMRLYLQDMLQQAMQQCQPQLDPSQFCVMTSGSYAHNNTTFSDIEFAILIEDESVRQKIYPIITLLFLSTMNLMETPIRALNIPELEFLYNDFDHPMNAGLRFDGGKSRLYPLEITDICSKMGSFSLVQTPRQMLHLVRDHLSCSDHMLSYNFLSPDFLMGDKTLHSRYLHLVQSCYFKKSLRADASLLHEYSMELMTKDLKKYYPKLKELYVFKHEIYGVFNLFKTMKILFNLKSNDHWEQITELHQRNIINFDMCTRFNKFINWIQYYRMQLYIKNHGQHDQMPVLLDPGIVDKYGKKPHMNYFLSDVHGLIDTFYSTAVYLNKFVHVLTRNNHEQVDMTFVYPFADIVHFISDYLVRDNALKSKIKCHQFYGKISDLFLNEKSFQSTAELPLVFLSIRSLICLVNYHILSNTKQLVPALLARCDAFVDGSLGIKHKANYHSWLHLSEKGLEHLVQTAEIAMRLRDADPRLPTLVAQVLYLKARCFFYQIGKVHRAMSYRLASKACELRQWIDRYPAVFDDTWNEHGLDSSIFMRSAKLYHLFDAVQTEIDLLIIVQAYNKLLRFDDNINAMECHHRLTLLYIKLYSSAANPIYYQQAFSNYKKVERLFSALGDFSFEKKLLNTKIELTTMHKTTGSSPLFFSRSIASSSELLLGNKDKPKMHQ